ncbi:Ubiquitin-related modifier 1 homolog 1 [Galdieria sulphuraria]|uniref:Ubiquitin-related modifier 1 homolog n=1 Tax=Galdieria sulphuraria TaxID=130081 RepID=M2XYP2_GALSU|nr:ubiquitin related modifier 1 [Galdieria sulphuraria]EME28768.1 ubiquitin related modifier 1 [Galdieria sulphuraria]GJD07116.1 Ubiquitin-related modifier 1 homolog 1 [Galdieria sulphuraria]|eukprot:XP_005705288.1 ubiquitin related modifier 1 [Galdieria sulphuraria]
MPQVELQFGGGLESLTGGNKVVPANFSGEQVVLGRVIDWIRTCLIKEKHEYFVQGEHIRPGILVLINDVDWELEGKTSYVIQEGDRITFISTLHGG